MVNYFRELTQNFFDFYDALAIMRF